MENNKQTIIINLVQEIIQFLKYNYNFTYNSNTDCLDYQYLNLQAEYGSVESDGINKISHELYQEKNILCPPDLLSGILHSIKSGLRHCESGYLN